jgi:hypothetical protein
MTPPSGEEAIYTLCDPMGSVIAGNTAFAGVPTGFSDLMPDSPHEGVTGYKLFRGQLGDNDLVVGTSEGDTEHWRGSYFSVSAGPPPSCSPYFTVGLLGAAVLRYRAHSRIFAVSQTAHPTGNRELPGRFAVSARVDEIDVLSSEVNVALGRLEASVTALKQVTTDIAHDLKPDEVRNAVEAASKSCRHSPAPSTRYCE